MLHGIRKIYGMYFKPIRKIKGTKTENYVHRREGYSN